MTEITTKIQEKKYLVVKGHAGLGNRLQSLLYAIELSKIMERKLIIDWTDSMYSQQGENAFTNLISLVSTEYQTDIPSSNSVTPKFWKNRMSKNVEDFSRIRTNTVRRRHFRKIFNVPNQKYDILVFWAFNWDNALERTLHNYALSHGISKDYSNRIKTMRDLASLMRFNSEIEEAALFFYKQNFVNEVIGVHVRYTDRKSPLKNYFMLIDALLKQKKYLRIFVATDNAKIEDIFKKRYGNLVFCFPKKYPQDEGPIHRNQEALSKKQILKEALIEMRLLSMSDYLIYNSNSSYSEMSYVLTRAKDSNCFDISNYNSPITAIIYFKDFSELLLECVDTMEKEESNSLSIDLVLICLGQISELQSEKLKRENLQLILRQGRSDSELFSEAINKANGEVLVFFSSKYFPGSFFLSKGVTALNNNLCGMVLGRIEYIGSGMISKFFSMVINTGRDIFHNFPSLTFYGLDNIFVNRFIFDDIEEIPPLDISKYAKFIHYKIIEQDYFDIEYNAAISMSSTLSVEILKELFQSLFIGTQFGNKNYPIESRIWFKKIAITFDLIRKAILRYKFPELIKILASVPVYVFYMLILASVKLIRMLFFEIKIRK